MSVAEIAPGDDEIRRLIAELRVMCPVVEAGEAAKIRRLEIWLRLRDLGVTQRAMAAASGMTHVGVSQALSRHDQREIRDRKERT